MFKQDSLEKPIVKMTEVIQSAAKTGKRLYILSPWGYWEFDGFWDTEKALQYYIDHYNDRFQYLYGNTDYMTIQRKGETI